jgi:hypothetical protein
MHERCAGSIVPLCAAALVIAAASAPCAAADLVKDGKPVATVVLAFQPAAADAPGGRVAKRAAAGQDGLGEEQAVKILVEWVGKITDAELPVASAAPPAGTAIYVGKAAVDAGLKLDGIESPSREGLRIVVDSNRILIAGQTEPATLKAVCRFLETLGCRYFMDGPVGQVFPRTPNLSAAAMTVTEKPGLLFRGPKGPTWMGGYWKAWNGAGGERIDHAHAWGRYVRPGLFNEHPDWFAMGRDGQRKEGQWLCTSNPELRKYFAERVIEAIKGGQTNPSISPPDGTGYCQCPACKAQDDPRVTEPSSGLVSVSKRYADFFDDVGRQVARECPNSVLSFYCYADYTQPPDLGRCLSPNLCAFVAPIRYCRLHEIGNPACPSRLQEVSMLEGWARIANKLGYYNYMYNLADGTLPMFKFTQCKKDIPYLKAKGLTAMTEEVLSNWHVYGPHIYLGLRLAYDPRADADAIMDDYWSKFYGPAAPHMKRYWMGIDAAQQRLKCHSGSFYGLAQIYTSEFLDECRAALGRAAEAAEGAGPYAERVAMHAEGLKSAAEYRRICEATARGDFAGAKGIFDAAIARIEGLVDKGYANREYGTAYLRRFLGGILAAGAAATAPPSKVLAVLPDGWRLAYDPQDQGAARHWHEAGFDDAAWPTACTYSKTLDAQGLYKTTILWYRTGIDVRAQHGRLTLFFAEVDGWSEVYVNGQKVAVSAPQGAREPAKAEVKPGDGASREAGGRSASTGKEVAAAVPAARQEGRRADPAAPPAATPSREGQARPRTAFEVDITAAVRPGRNVVAVRVDHQKITELFLGGIIRPVLLIDKGP